MKLADKAKQIKEQLEMIGWEPDRWGHYRAEGMSEALGKVRAYRLKFQARTIRHEVQVTSETGRKWWFKLRSYGITSLDPKAIIYPGIPRDHIVKALARTQWIGHDERGWHAVLAPGWGINGFGELHVKTNKTLFRLLATRAKQWGVLP